MPPYVLTGMTCLPLWLLQHEPQLASASLHAPTPRQHSVKTVGACSVDHLRMAELCPSPACMASTGAPIRSLLTAKRLGPLNPRAGSMRRLQITTTVGGIRLPCLSTTSALSRITAIAAGKSGASARAPDRYSRWTGGVELRSPDAVICPAGCLMRRAWSSWGTYLCSMIILLGRLVLRLGGTNQTAS